MQIQSALAGMQEDSERSRRHADSERSRRHADSERSRRHADSERSRRHAGRFRALSQACRFRALSQACRFRAQARRQSRGEIGSPKGGKWNSHKMQSFIFVSLWKAKRTSGMQHSGGVIKPDCVIDTPRTNQQEMHFYKPLSANINQSSELVFMKRSAGNAFLQASLR